MDDKTLYEELGAVADQLPEGWREHFAELTKEILLRGSDGRVSIVQRWLTDAGYARYGASRPSILDAPPIEAPPRAAIEAARDEAAVRNARQFGTDPSWYGR